MARAVTSPRRFQAGEPGAFGLGWRLPLRDTDIATDVPATGRESEGVYGAFREGTRLYLSVQFNDVVRPNYLWPAAGESIQAELLIDGKMVRSVLLNAASFNDPANYFRTDATRVDLIQEVEVKI